MKFSTLKTILFIYTSMQLPAKEYKALQEELLHRTDVLRPEINKDINEAAALGDIPENFPYHAAVERQQTNESRIQDLEKIMKNVKIKTEETSQIILGSSIKLKINERIIDLILVDQETLQRNPKQGFISDKSPLGRKLINKKIGDEIIVNAPIGQLVYKVLKVT